MPNNIKLTLSYDGTHYYGWQRTTSGPSIQESLESSLSLILQSPIKVNGASRTDSGVHAMGQVANFITEKEITPKNLFALNRVLPKDITVKKMELVPLDFHATLSVSFKQYRYELSNREYQLPQDRYFQWHYPYDLDEEEMQKACQMLVGKRDFEALTNQKKNESYEDHVRDLKRFEFVNKDDRFTFLIEGDNFLYKMVRNLVGLVVYVGRRKIKLDEIEAILESKDRTKSGITTPAHGLFLDKVVY